MWPNKITPAKSRDTNHLVVELTVVLSYGHSIIKRKSSIQMLRKRKKDIK